MVSRVPASISDSCISPAIRNSRLYSTHSVQHMPYRPWCYTLGCSGGPSAPKPWARSGAIDKSRGDLAPLTRQRAFSILGTPGRPPSLGKRSTIPPTPLSCRDSDSLFPLAWILGVEYPPGSPSRQRHISRGPSPQASYCTCISADIADPPVLVLGNQCDGSCPWLPAGGQAQHTWSGF